MITKEMAGSVAFQYGERTTPKTGNLIADIKTDDRPWAHVEGKALRMMRENPQLDHTTLVRFLEADPSIEKSMAHKVRVFR